MTNAEMDELFALYAADNPGAPAYKRMVELPDGRTEMMVDLDTLESFLRWCLRKKLGDRVKIIETLSDLLPRMRMPNWGGLLTKPME